MAVSIRRSTVSSSYTYMQVWEDYEVMTVDCRFWGEFEIPLEDLESVTFSMVKAVYIKMTEHWDEDADGVLCFMRTKKFTWPMIASVLERTMEECRGRFIYLTDLAKHHKGMLTPIIGQMYFLKMRQYPAMLYDIKEKTEIFEQGKAELDESYDKSMASSELNRESLIPEDWLENLSDINNPIDSISSMLSTSLTVPSATSTNLSFGYTPGAARAMHAYRNEVFNPATRERIVRGFARQFPELRRLRPSDWEDDMETKLLAVLEARDRGTKWERLSADYANWTGVTISPQVLKWRFGGCDIMDRTESAKYFRFDRPYK
ncbi:hypothetical protein F5Y02DRAFT_418884 [Annulohypoxylon stygium]|nr:hypothetical protein F5Y02DRAFT_418884 [Annulohypoxylon stygium]